MVINLCQIQVADDQKEMLLAFLAELSFSGFEETPEGWKGFVEPGKELDQLESDLIEVQKRIPFSYRFQELPVVNWNETWEANFSPIQVGDFCWIRAPFHPENPQVPYQITILPKMAFGTGHHETTSMMIASMKSIQIQDRTVLDFGCGTGILAILAKKMGAQLVEGIDISQEAYQNSLENAALNSVDIQFRVGSLEIAGRQRYDVILANITRNVILEHLHALYKRTSKGGEIVFSGILLIDEPILTKELLEIGFTLIELQAKNKWICLRAKKQD